MREFNFTTSGQGQGSRSDISQGNLRLNRTRVTIGSDVYKKLGEPARLVLEHDVKAKAIRLTLAPHALAGYSVQFRADPRSKSPYIKTIKVQEFLPLGEYLPISTNIFVHESVQR